MPKPASLRAPGIALFGLTLLLLAAGLPAFPPAATGQVLAPAVVQAASPAQGAPGGAVRSAQEETHGGKLPPEDEARAEHHPSIWSTVARLVNFAILVGVLVYFMRSPFAQYLVTRSRDIRRELTEAAAASEAATAEMAEIDRRLQSLPGELEALRRRGVEEIAAEEARIREAAKVERERLLEQAHKEIDLRLHQAERELRRHAADLAVSIAAARIRQTIGRDDHLRLVDEYVGQIGAGS